MHHRGHILVLTLLGVVGPLLAEQAMDAPTLLAGLQHRKELMANVAGRVVIGHKSMKLGSPEPQSHIALLDFARSGDRYRTELRVILPGGNWWVFDAQIQEGDEFKAIDPRLMYMSKIREGDFVCTYDRSMNRASCSSSDGPASPRALRLQSDIDGYVVPAYATTLPDGLVKWMLDGTLTTSVQGVDKIEGHDCYRVCAGSKRPPGEGRGYFRIWIAPDMDFGAPRYEHVEVNAKGEPISCSVTNAKGWRKDAGMGLWRPETYQADHFQYLGHKEWGSDRPGWTHSVFVARISLTTQTDALMRALPLRYPFDCRFRNVTSNEVEDDPTLYPDELRPLLQYEAPDALGIRLLTDKDVEGIFRQ